MLNNIDIDTINLFKVGDFICVAWGEMKERQKKEEKRGRNMEVGRE
jgi:hypothetical protein